ncbi:hypothetical protein CDV31_014836 [Fusarium ambrosium]|uniref:Uncharacterized protein n=1 Tax=Fusarium ambrosium TaxID=131363 RepID=A0A428STN4_9HYPO|nr:hypothetical protein CDV31_014836 [Fusarium ambrosium]
MCQLNSTKCDSCEQTLAYHKTFCRRMAAPTAGGGRRDGVDGYVGGTTAPARPIQRLRRIQDGESEFESGSKRDPTRSIFDGIIAMSY